MVIDVNVTGGEISGEEINYYVESAKEKFSGKCLTAIDLDVDGEYINAAYHFSNEPFQRIRRITGYLVHSLDSFNNAKRSEERDRVKHGM